MSYLLGIDLGASDLKVNVVASDDLSLVAQARHPIKTYHPHDGWAEQYPHEWELALIHALGELKKAINLQQLSALSITAGAHIPVILDKQDTPLRPAIMWSDQRSAQNALSLMDHARFITDSLNQPQATWTAAMLDWLRTNEPSVMTQCAHILPAKDYLRFLLSGERYTDPSDAIGFLLAQDKGQQWSTPLCTQVGLSTDQLPSILPSLSIESRVSDRGAHRFDLPAGCPIITGGIDTSVELLTGLEPGREQSLIKMASAGVVYRTSSQAIPKPPISLYPSALPDHYYYASGMNSCATSLRWLTNVLLGEAASTLELFELAQHSSPGANGVLSLPYFLGERAPLWNANIRAATLGMTHRSTRADLSRSMIEGTCFALYDVYQSMEKRMETNAPTGAIHLIGGGSKSPLWTQTLANIFNQEMRSGAHSDAAYSAALIAGLALDMFDISTVVKRNQTDQHIIPESRWSSLYQDKWHYYQEAQAFMLGQADPPV